MLSENIYVNKDGYNVKDISKEWSFSWVCPKCGSRFEVNRNNIEDFTDSDPHDPLQDYFICPECECSTGMFKGVKGISDNMEALLWADGSFIYLSTEKGYKRVV